MLQINRNTILAVGIVIPFVQAVKAEPEPAEIRGTLQEWVRIESNISREKSDWAAEKSILVDRIALLKAEESRLREQIEQSKSGVGEIEEKRLQLSGEREAIRAVVESIKTPLGMLEGSVQDLYRTFPAPLQEEVRRLAERLPEEAKGTRLSVAERLQAVVGILNFADKFNSGVQREVEIRSIGDRQVEVTTLYFGLAGAFFADETGRYAGIGFPGEQGWQWQDTLDDNQAIGRLIASYEGTREAAFIPVPVKLPQ